MKILFIILKKEFLQIFRNKVFSKMIFILPVVQLLILANAVTFDIKNLKLLIIDNDKSTASRKLISKFYSTDYFKTEIGNFDIKAAEHKLEKSEIDLYLIIPPNFEKDIEGSSKSGIGIIINAIDGAKAGIASYYTLNICNNFIFESISFNTNQNVHLKKINLEYSYWYNHELKYTTFMVPGILAMLVSLIALFLSSINIVREKESGTIEQLNVTPIKKHQLILGKLLPFWIIGIFELALGLVISKLIYDIPILGSVLLLFFISAIYLTVILGIGFFISTITETQQQAMFVTWVCMVIMILMSGLFTPVENMPSWAQTIDIFNPIKIYMQSVRMLMLKGSGFNDLSNLIILLIIFSFAINTLAIVNYRKTL